MATHARRLTAARLSLAASALALLTMGLTVCALRAIADDPAGPGGAARSKPGAGEGFVLLKDGRLIGGAISREGSVYVVKQRIGTMRFPKKMVAGSFGSVHAAYSSLLKQLPEDDPGERMKLARWCMSQHLTAEAREQLDKVLEISPNHGPAQAMVANMENSLRGVESTFDPEVLQTKAERVMDDGRGPREGNVDRSVLLGAERGLRVSGQPVIFDLPPGLALRRTEEFVRYIQPLLQAKCAKCHNARYDGPFQLVPIATARQRTPAALRANLDATLRLIDPENPARSELLSSTLRPHGDGPRKRPIFMGSNDRVYRVLAAWANSLASRPRDAAVTRASADSGGHRRDGQVFGGDRAPAPDAPLEAVVPGLAPQRRPAAGVQPPQPQVLPAFRYQPGEGMVVDDLSKSGPNEFPVPYLMGGPKPKLLGNGQPAPASNAPPSGGNSVPGPKGPAASTAGPSAAGGLDRLPPLPQSSTPSPDAAPGAAGAAAPRARKPVKINPSLLQKLLQQSKNQPAANQGQ